MSAARHDERRGDDPEGAITSARTLLETVCNHILDESGAHYDDDADLPKLYRVTAEALHLAPSQQSEDNFKRIFGGCQTVVENLGSLRNKLSDAHGKGRSLTRPEPRHAELAVNLWGDSYVSRRVLGGATVRMIVTAGQVIDPLRRKTRRYNS